jgi:uncharacterized protein involved in type VI secretion and phage assembly
MQISRPALDAPLWMPPARCQLAEVVSVEDPERKSRIQVRLLAYDGVGEQDAPIWARLVVPFAGDKRGAFLVPDVGDEVLVQFVQGDSRQAVVLGALWNGKTEIPETLGGSGKRVDRWTLTGRDGTRIAIVEDASGARIELSTPGGVTGTLTDEEGGKIELSAAGSTITIDPTGVRVETQGSVNVQASDVSVTAGSVSVEAAVSTFSGAITCQSLTAGTVSGGTYTPGVGQIW